MTASDADIAVLIPCYQEELTIAQVVADFRRELPRARIYVFDNNCTDRTAERAREAGATVIREKRQGKGFVVASMFETIDADILVMVDGDGTYDASAVHALIAPILKGDADTTLAARLTTFEASSFRNFHLFGNKMVCWIINKMFGCELTDIFSGFRAFNRDAVRRIPITSYGFDVETEMTLQALYRGAVMKEIEAPYGVRPEGSSSKLNTFSDGARVLLKLGMMLKSYKPLTLFGGLGFLLAIVSFLVGIRPVLEYIEHQYVFSLPSAVLAAALMILAFGSAALGILLNSLNLRLREIESILGRQLRHPSA